MEKSPIHSSREAIVARNVTKAWGSLVVLDGVSFSVARSEVVALLGRSGSGKSTLMRCINHLETIDDGEIYVNGDLIGYREKNGVLYELSDAEISAQRRMIGMVFQSFNLFRHMTALDNIAVGPSLVLRKPKDEAYAIATELLQKVGLGAKGASYPSQLSGGQQQRIAIARALAVKPDVLLLDEPTSALDPGLSQEVIATIRDVASEGQTMMIATHEMEIAKGFADRVIFMVDGRICEDVPARQFFGAPGHPESQQFVQRFS